VHQHVNIYTEQKHRQAKAFNLKMSYENN